MEASRIIALSPSITEIDGQPGDAHHCERTADNDGQDLQASKSEEFAVIEDRNDGRYEEQHHVSDEPFGAAANAEDAQPPRRKQQQDHEHPKDATRDGQAGELDHALPSKPEGQEKPELQRLVPMDETPQACADRWLGHGRSFRVPPTYGQSLQAKNELIDYISF
jgi:hypothetical protein